MHLVIHFTTVILTKFMNGVQSSLVNSTIDFTKNSPKNVLNKKKNVLNKKSCCVVNVTSLSIDHYTPIGKDFSEQREKKTLYVSRPIDNCNYRSHHNKKFYSHLPTIIEGVY